MFSLVTCDLQVTTVAQSRSGSGRTIGAMADTPPTPLAAALDSVGDRWTLLLVEALLDGPRRFGDLQEALGGIAPNVLTQRLRRLAGEGVVLAQPYSERPERFIYELTVLGPRAGRGAAAAGRLGREASRSGRAAAPRGLRHARRGPLVVSDLRTAGRRRRSNEPALRLIAAALRGHLQDGSRIPCNCYVEPFWTTSPHAVSKPEDGRRAGPRRDPQAAGPKAPVATRNPSIGAAAWWPRERLRSCCCS